MGKRKRDVVEEKEVKRRNAKEKVGVKSKPKEKVTGVSKARLYSNNEKKSNSSARSPVGESGARAKGGASSSTSALREPRRSARNRESSLPPDVRKRLSETRERDVEKEASQTHRKEVKRQRSKTPEAKSVHVEVYEPPVAEPLALSASQTEKALEKAEDVLHEQEMKRKASYGVRPRALCFKRVVPEPPLLLSREEEIRPALRNGGGDADLNQFSKYFNHPYLVCGERQRKNKSCNDTEVECADNALQEAITGDAPETTQGLKSPSPTHGDHPTPLKGSRSQRREGNLMGEGLGARGQGWPLAKNKPRYDVLAIQRISMAARGRRTTRVSGKHVKYAESDEDNHQDSSEYHLSEEGPSSDNMSDEDDVTEDVRDVLKSLSWEYIFPEDMDMDESCYRSVSVVAPFKFVGMRKSQTPTMHIPPCVVAPFWRVRYRPDPKCSTASDSTQSLVGIGKDVGGGCEVSGPPANVTASRTNKAGELADLEDQETRNIVVKQINSGDGSALDQFAMAVRQVVKATARSDGLVPPEGEVFYSPWSLKIKETYTWYSGFDVVHGMSYIHPLVLQSFVPVHPLYHGDSPRVKALGPLCRIPRMDPSKDYMRASLQYLRLCALQAGNLPSPPMETQKLVARQYQQYESMLDRIREVQKQKRNRCPGPLHRNVHVKALVGNQSFLLTPLLFSPRHLLVGEDPDHFYEREKSSSRKKQAPMTSSLQELIKVPLDDVSPQQSQPVATLFDRGLISQPLHRGKYPLRLNDLPPPFPTTKPSVLTRKIVYRTRTLDATPGPSSSGATSTPLPATQMGNKANSSILPPRLGPEPTDKGAGEIERKREQELRAYERKVRLRAEMGEEAWAAEMRRREEHRMKKKIMYQTTKKCKDALEWCRDAAKFPTTQTFNQHIVIGRLCRAIQVIREQHLKKQQNLHNKSVVHYTDSKSGGVFVRLRTAEDEEELARQAEERERLAREKASKEKEESGRKMSEKNVNDRSRGKTDANGSSSSSSGDSGSELPEHDQDPDGR